MQATMMIAALVLGAPTIKDAPKKDIDIVGEWVVVNQERDGKGGDFFADTMSFTADSKWARTYQGREAKNCDKYVLDTTAKPAIIDLLFTKDTNVAGAYGIIRVDGDTLTMCLSYSSRGRPSKFESQVGSSNMLIVMKRAKKK